MLFQFIRFVTGSRLAQWLLIIHLLVVVYAFASKPLAKPDSLYSGGSCHGVPIADRVFYRCDETGLLKVIGILDFVGVLLYALVATGCLLIAFFLSFNGMVLPGISFHVLSWVVAAVLLVCTSFQWMLFGSCIERLLRRFGRNS